MRFSSCEKSRLGLRRREVRCSFRPVPITLMADIGNSEDVVMLHGCEMMLKGVVAITDTE